MPKVLLKSGLRFHYQRVGKGPDLVMIHGLSGNLAVWHLNIIPLLMDHFRITTYDLRGHGYSDMPPTGYLIEDMAADLRDLLDALEIDRASIVGHSFGADIAFYFALLYPERAKQIVAMEAAIPALTHLRTSEEWEGWSYWAKVLEKSGHPIPEDKRFDVEYLLRTSLEMPKKWGPLRGLPRDPKPFLRLLETTSLVKDYEVLGELTLDQIPRIQVPVHLIYGESSAFLHTHDFLMEHLPNAHSILLPWTEWGHFGPLEQPEVVAGHLMRILDRTPSAAVEAKPTETARQEAGTCTPC